MISKSLLCSWSKSLISLIVLLLTLRFDKMLYPSTDLFWLQFERMREPSIKSIIDVFPASLVSIIDVTLFFPEFLRAFNFSIYSRLFNSSTSSSRSQILSLSFSLDKVRESIIYCNSSILSSFSFKLRSLFYIICCYSSSCSQYWVNFALFAYSCCFRALFFYWRFYSVSCLGWIVSF